MVKIKALIPAGMAALVAVGLSAFPVYYVHGFAGSSAVNMKLIKEALTYEFLCLLVISYGPSLLAMRALRDMPVLPNSRAGLVAAIVVLGGCIWFRRDLLAIHEQELADALAVAVNWLVILGAVLDSYVVFAPVAVNLGTGPNEDVATLPAEAQASKGSRAIWAIDLLAVPGIVLCIILGIFTVGFAAILLHGLWQLWGTH